MWRSSPAGSRQFSWPRDETGHFGDQAQMGKFPGLTHSSHMIDSSCDNIPVVLQAVAKVWEWKRGPGARFDVRGRTETEAKLPTLCRRPSCRIRLPPAVLSLNSFCSLFGRLSTGGTSWNDTPAATRAAGWRNPKCHHYQLAQREYRRLFLFRRMAWETRLILMFQEEAAGAIQKGSEVGRAVHLHAHQHLSHARGRGEDKYWIRFIERANKAENWLNTGGATAGCGAVFLPLRWLWGQMSTLSKIVSSQYLGWLWSKY